jgi:uncharacterized protein involved in outer membrane biogenesis
VRIGDIHVEWSASFAPTVRLRDVEVQNAPWAAPRPMAKVGEVDFVFASLKTLLVDDPHIVSNLILIDGDVDMEMQADGLRNWRLRDPQYRGPGKYQVLRLEARNSQVHFVNRAINLDLAASEAPSAAGSGNAPTGEAFSKRLRLQGTYSGRPFEADLLTGDVLTLQRTQSFFPARGYFASGRTRLDIDGRLADFFKQIQANVSAHLSGPTLADLYPFIRTHPPASPPYQLQGRLLATADEYALSGFHGRVGASDVSGSASATRNATPREWHADLHSNEVRLADFMPMFDTQRVTAGSAAHESHATGETQAGRFFSSKPLHMERLEKDNAHVALDVKKFHGDEMPMLQSLRATLALRGGVLNVSSFDLGIAGGHASGRMQLDGSKQPAAANLTLDARGIELGRLSAKAAAKLSGAPISAHASLAVRGDSLAALAASASGPLRVGMEGGTISGLLDAELDLSAAKILWRKLAGDKPVPLNCAIAAIDFRNGIGTPRTLLIDTAQMSATGSGSINLRDEQFDLLLTPHAKQARLFALGSGIRLYGSFRQPAYAIEKGAQPAAAIAETCPPSIAQTTP